MIKYVWQLLRSYIHLKTNKHIFWYYFICFLHKFYECSPYPKHFQLKCYFCLPKILHETLVIKDLHMKSNMTQNYLTNNRHICTRDLSANRNDKCVSRIRLSQVRNSSEFCITWSESCQSKSLFFLWSIFYFLDNQLISVRKRVTSNERVVKRE